MTTGSSHSRSGCLGRDELPHPWSMSPTSHLAHHPLGAAVARSPQPASGGGGEGWSILLVGQSERGGNGLGALFGRIRMRGMERLEPAWEESAGMCMRPPDGGIDRSRWQTRATHEANSCWG